MDRPLNLLLTLKTALKNQGRNARELRTMTTNNVTVSFLSDDTAPDEYARTFRFTFRAIVTYEAMTVKSIAIISEAQMYLLTCGVIRKKVAAADAGMTAKNQMQATALK